jgi:hypothetical protein
MQKHSIMFAFSVVVLLASTELFFSGDWESSEVDGENYYGRATPFCCFLYASTRTRFETRITAFHLRVCWQDIHALMKLHGSVKAEAPMHTVQFVDFEHFGKFPRSSDRRTSACNGPDKLDFFELKDVFWDEKLIFISHRWLRPWHTQEECEAQGHEWAGMAHPDDAAGSKHKLICEGVRKLAEKKGWDINKVSLWLDFCGVEQDNAGLLMAGVQSLRGYISVCDALLIPSPKIPDAASDRTVDKIPGEYGGRAWTRLESMSFYTVSATFFLIFLCTLSYLQCVRW